MNQIQKVSRCFRYLFLVVLVFLPILQVGFWLTDGQLFGVKEWLRGFDLQMIPPNLPPLSTLSSEIKFFGFLINCIPMAFTMVVVFFIQRLFKLYEEMKIFSESNVQCIRKIGWTLLCAQMAQPIYQVLITFVLSFHNPVGQRVVALDFDQDNLMGIFWGFLLILVSWIMNEGRKLEEEQKYTI